MIILDEHGGLNDFLGDPNRKIPAAHLKQVCKKDQTDGSACRYLNRNAIGWVCAKNTPARAKVDEAVILGIMKRNLSDNCDGFGTL